ncbi:hypothetical protein BDZ91DRAFT_455140 [Kalaharituber pfeilii]|nr:hypothetical protein BDZ91DRAFT_455140 [Kalaharituber pfeilii]
MTLWLLSSAARSSMYNCLYPQNFVTMSAASAPPMFFCFFVCLFFLRSQLLALEFIPSSTQLSSADHIFKSSPVSSQPPPASLKLRCIHQLTNKDATGIKLQ